MEINDSSVGYNNSLRRVYLGSSREVVGHGWPVMNSQYPESANMTKTCQVLCKQQL